MLRRRQTVERAVIHDMLVYTRHSLPLQHCGEALDGHGVLASCLQETDYINSTCLRRSKRKKALIFRAHSSKELNPLHQSIMRSHTAKKKEKQKKIKNHRRGVCVCVGGGSYSTVMRFHDVVFWTGCTAAILSKHSTVCSPPPLNGILHSMLTKILKCIHCSWSYTLGWLYSLLL